MQVLFGKCFCIKCYVCASRTHFKRDGNSQVFLAQCFHVCGGFTLLGLRGKSDLWRKEVLFPFPPPWLFKKGMIFWIDKSLIRRMKCNKPAVSADKGFLERGVPVQGFCLGLKVKEIRDVIFNVFFFWGGGEKLFKVQWTTPFSLWPHQSAILRPLA